MILADGYWAGLTLYPQTKISPQRAVDIIEKYGPDRICVAGACDWGPSEPVAVPKFALEMRRRGHSEAADPEGHLREPGPIPQPIGEIQDPACCGSADSGGGKIALQIDKEGFLHLCYCTNIHPGDSWAAVNANVRKFAPALRARFAPTGKFGLGLRLSARDARELLEGGRLDEFRSFLDAEGVYVALINGFPYGPFHGTVVKADVYAPDWREEARVRYTLDLAQVLRRLLPEGLDGGISTSPLSYKLWLMTPTHGDWETMTHNVARVAAALAEIRRETGRFIHLDIEPEPDCLIENSGEVVEFFERWLLPVGGAYLAARLGVDLAEAQRRLRDHVQICFDCCHFAVEYEDPLAALEKIAGAGIRIGRVQLSSALRVDLPPHPEQRAAVSGRLAPFAESTYLHQVVEKRGGCLHHFPDLGNALSETPGRRQPMADSLSRAALHRRIRRPRLHPGLCSNRPRSSPRHPLHAASRDRDVHLGRAPGGIESRFARLDRPRVPVGAGSASAMNKTVVINVVGLTAKLLGPSMPRLSAWAAAGRHRPDRAGVSGRYLHGAGGLSHRTVSGRARRRRQRLVFARRLRGPVLAAIEQAGRRRRRSGKRRRRPIHRSPARTCSGGSTCIRRRTIRLRRGPCIWPTAESCRIFTPVHLTCEKSSSRASADFRYSISGVRGRPSGRPSGSRRRRSTSSGSSTRP